MSTLVLTPNVSGGVALDLLSATTKLETGFKFPLPLSENLWVETPDMEGRRRSHTRPTNPTGEGSIVIDAATEAAFWTAFDELQSTVAAVNRWGGTLAFDPDGAEAVTYVIVAIDLTDAPNLDQSMGHGWGRVSFSFECEPYGLLADETITSNETGSEPVLTFEVGDVPGHVDALGELTLTDTATQERWLAEYGVEHNFSPLASAAAEYEALILDGEPLAYWPLNESSGTNADEQIQGYDGTATGGLAMGGSDGPLSGSLDRAPDLDGSTHYIATAYTTRQNLVTNPAAGTNLTSLTGTSLPTYERVTSLPTLTGLPSGVTTGVHCIGDATSDRVSYQLTTTVQTYTFSAYVYIVSLSATSVGIQLGTDVATTAVVGSWQRLSASTTGTGVSQTFRLCQQNGAGAAEWYATGFQIEASSSLGTYFDGSLTTAQPDVAWEGTAHASVSVKGALINAPRTVEAWIYRDTNTTTDAIFCGNQSGNGPTLHCVSGGNDLRLYSSSGSATWSAALPAPPTFSYVAVTVASGTAEAFVNGVSAGTQALTIANPTLSTAAIGTSASPATAHFDGRLSHIAIYPRVLTGAEILERYTVRGAGPVDPNPPMLDQPELNVTGLAGASASRSGRYSTNTYQATLTTTPVAVCSTGSQTHVGLRRIYARVYADTADTYVRAEYRIGDGAWTSNAWAAALEDNWSDLYLGLVEVPLDETFEVRIVAKCATAGGVLDVDIVYPFPADRWGRARRGSETLTPSAFSAWSDFTTETGAITGDSLRVGGTWAGAGDAVDFSVAAGVATRTEVSDAAGIQSGRLITASTPTLATSAARVDFTTNAIGIDVSCGVLLRYVATTDFIAVYVEQFNATTTQYLRLAIRVASSTTTYSAVLQEPMPLNTFYTVTGMAMASGLVFAWLTPQGAPLGAPDIMASSTAAATGGAIDDGKVGIVDHQPHAGANTRTYDNFTAWVPEAQAVAFSGQSMRFLHNKAQRENAVGTTWGRVPIFEGQHLKIPAAGREDRSSRIAVRARRNDITTMPDGNLTDALRADLVVTPRVLLVSG